MPSLCVFGTNAMVKAAATCLYSVLLATKDVGRQRSLAITVCFWHQTCGEGNDRLPAPCVLRTRTMVKETSSCLQCFFGTKLPQSKLTFFHYLWAFLAPVVRVTTQKTSLSLSLSLSFSFSFSFSFHSFSFLSFETFALSLFLFL